MNINPIDGVCRSCGGPLQIIDSDDYSLTVACVECSDTYDVEADAFGDGCMTYQVDIMTRRLMEEVDGPERHHA
jgi:hypothetical protein